MSSLEKEKNLELSEDKFSSPLCPVEHPTLLVLAGELHLALLVQHQGEGVLLQVLDVCLEPRWTLGPHQGDQGELQTPVTVDMSSYELAK